MEETKAVFPLKVVAIEQYYAVLGTPHYPVNYWVDLDFSGRFEKNAFKKAVSLAVKIHPLFSALFQGDGKEKISKNFWIEAKGVTPFIDWNHMGSPLSFPKGPWIDLHQEVGIRFFIREGSNKTKLLIQVHHACADGMGTMLFIKDLFEIYTLIQANGSKKKWGANGLEKLENEISQSLPIKKKLLLNRNHFRSRKKVFNFRTFFKNFRELIYFFAKWPKPLVVPVSNKKTVGEANEVPRYLSFTFTQENTKVLYATAMKKGVALFSLLLRDLFLTIDHWNKKKDPREKNRSIRILVPVNLRHLLNSDMPATNFFGLLFIRQNRKLFRDPDRLLKAINHYLLTAIHRNWGLFFLKSLDFFGKFKRGFNKFTANEVCYATALLSYMGDINELFSPQDLDHLFQATGLRLEHVSSGLTPVGETYIGILSGIFDGRLNVSLGYQPKKFTGDDAQEFLALYVNRIGNSTA